ncbi:glycerophosphoryl diester phosphodiesterase membrane domain-containing protein [Cellulomonas rhizosphaerae]|uniref:glycerophosphoryl diester phosphodiesterase membrane domain-containing protein n=1 Tax=Cellulomonas rhizosphaerae TaxID=2293719 RepID=UPI001F48FD40|nr:glycerophosphoryl diester phosphodiesterase membrane domain-containing protein [Cellulomonas rhizosphaerae]
MPPPPAPPVVPPAPPLAPPDLTKPVPPGAPPVAPPVPVQGWGGQPAWNGQPGWGAPAPSAWRPPALQPGIVPLRPLGLGEILDGAFKAVRANPRVMFGLSAIVVTIAVAVESVLRWYVAGLIDGAIADATASSDLFTESDTDGLGSALSQVLAAPITTVVTTILTGWLIISVSRSVIGQKVSPREVLRSKRIWLVVGFTALLGLAIAVVVGAYVALIVLFASQDLVGLAVGFGLLAGAALFVLLVLVSVRTLLVPPALMLEGKSFWSTVARAWRLTRGSFWRLLGIYLLVSLLVGVVTQIVVTPAAILSALVFSDPMGLEFGSIVVTGIAKIIALTLSTTYLASVVALLYIDVRIRREGLDIELARAADAAAASR